MTTDYERVRDAIGYIAEHASTQPTLDEVAAHVGLSPSHFQRVFMRWAGVSPKRFLQHLTAARAKELLRASVPVLDAAFAVGLSGPGRLHDLMVSAEAVTPGEYKSGGVGIEIACGVHETPFGNGLIGVTERGVCALRFLDGEDAEAAIGGLAAEWPGAAVVRDEGSTRAATEAVFGGIGEAHEPLGLLLRGTNFQLKVWEGLLRVPEGSLISYGDLAARIGEPTASRAVAGAVGANPIAYVIPCHRVLRATGALGGYHWGTDRKLVMLERELVAGGS